MRPTTLTLVCSAHPDLDWPHADCAGPGAPPEFRQQVLADALRDIRLAAVFGDPVADLWLSKRGIDVRSGT